MLLQDIQHAVLQRTGVAHSGYRDATIPVEESISHVCADLRRRAAAGIFSSRMWQSTT